MQLLLFREVKNYNYPYIYWPEQQLEENEFYNYQWIKL